VPRKTRFEQTKSKKTVRKSLRATYPTDVAGRPKSEHATHPESALPLCCSAEGLCAVSNSSELLPLIPVGTWVILPAFRSTFSYYIQVDPRNEKQEEAVERNGDFAKEKPMKKESGA
jgi:hypothetical protein